MSAIGGSAASALPGQQREVSSSGYSDMSSEEFVEIMLTELSNQDPLEPNDSQALLEQISTIRSIESDLEMIDRLEDMVSSNEFASATSLVGSMVAGVDDLGERVADLVLSVTKTSDGPIMNLVDGSRVPFANIDEVVTRSGLNDLEEAVSGSDDSDPDAGDSSLSDDSGGDSGTTSDDAGSDPDREGSS